PLARFVADVAQDDPRALGGEEARRGRPHTARPAGDQRHFVRQPVWHCAASSTWMAATVPDRGARVVVGSTQIPRADYADSPATNPLSNAHTAIWARELTPSLAMMFSTCRSAVRLAMTSCSAIWRLASPWAI